MKARHLRTSSSRKAGAAVPTSGNEISAARGSGISERGVGARSAVRAADGSVIKLAVIGFSAGTATGAGVTTDCGIAEGARSASGTDAGWGIQGTAIGDSDGGIATDSGMLVA
jgi:hypothetical protein